jgi:membrane fusion protein, heavy metal efflux system
MKTSLFQKPFLLGFILVLLGLTACQKAAEEAQTTEKEAEVFHVHISRAQMERAGLRMGMPERKPFRRPVNVTGYLHLPPQNQANVSSVLGGVVNAVTCYIGDRVSAGQVLARIDNPEFIRMQEEYLKANSRVGFLKPELDRQEELLRQDAGYLKKVQESRSNYQSEIARMQSFRLQLKNLGVDLAKLDKGELSPYVELRSPIPGTLNKIMVTTGQNVKPETPLFEVVDTRHLHIELQVYEKDFAYLKKGQIVRYTTAGDATQHTAEVFAIGRALDPATRTVSVHAELKDASANLLPGMYIQGFVETGAREAAALPIAAYQQKNKLWYAFRLKNAVSKDTLEFTPIKVPAPEAENGFAPLIAGPEDDKWVQEGAYYLMSIWRKSEGGDD